MEHKEQLQKILKSYFYSSPLLSPRQALSLAYKELYFDDAKIHAVLEASMVTWGCRDILYAINDLRGLILNKFHRDTLDEDFAIWYDLLLDLTTIEVEFRIGGHNYFLDIVEAK